MTVRVRFAPSPTGAPHIGNIHTALFNWLLARSTRGVFVLRVEDTDVERYEDGALASMIDGLRWLGLEWDEGPEVGGPFGPYFQSQRREYYQQTVDRLLAEGSAYRCYCSAERLDARRHEMLSKGQPPRYDGRCRYLSAHERAEEERRSASSVVRFKGPLDGQTTFDDLLRGTLTFGNRDLDDTILLKSDGYPTYHLANVVDDHMMEISHVLRAEEWIPSTPRHVLLYQALGWPAPRFAHLPLILNSDRTKLSKRAGSNGLDFYREAGYLPEAILNYLAMLGWSPPAGSSEVLSAADLVGRFSLDRLSRSPSVFDVDRLGWFNRQHLKRRGADELVELTAPLLAEAFGVTSRHEGTSFGADDWRKRLVVAASEEITTLKDIVEVARPLFGDRFALGPEAAQALDSPTAPDVLAAFVEGFRGIEPFDYDTINSYFKELRFRFKTERGISGRDVMFPIRAALTGTLKGPCLVVLVLLIGWERAIERVQAVMQKQ